MTKVLPDTTSIYINITPVNDAPVAKSDTFGVERGK